ncbi:hypothetical protein AVEN_267347-1 [Araneus ventricosus]|uniref:DDE-1 domain-containing protein n=1 Tax=Araneus ventricosus TaxID=182803 RepID=A0A4Y2DLT3_ARAVE|nr:hypothetical protein AVEN_267347-1 [Araneus ventricosus]
MDGLKILREDTEFMAKVISGESKDVDDNDSENWITETLSKILKDYEPENIFNADETSPIFSMFASKDNSHLKRKNELEQNKARLTVMLCANMTGYQKLKPLVNGRSKNPRCFKGPKSCRL